MLAIKLKRIGKKGQASFRIIVSEKRSKINGRFTADLGWYNAATDQFSVKNELAKDWILKGAQPTDSVHNLLVKTGVISGPKKAVHKKAAAKAETPTAAKPAAEIPIMPEQPVA
ncbi:MAG: 30S ribosomal protein S16 [Candidatus Brennerbacteria bacterium]|nr:30S ribosomal protein S16 [Candidatus Brennerbacteria bacterium]